jgi:uncharacterized protein GlcG (DUF336 family)
MPPDRGLAKEHGSGLKGNKTRITIAVTANADGSEKLPLLIIGKYAKPRAFQKKTGAQLGFEYYSNQRAWMTSVIFEDWIKKFDQKMKNKKLCYLSITSLLILSQKVAFQISDLSSFCPT